MMWALLVFAIATSAVGESSAALVSWVAAGEFGVVLSTGRNGPLQRRRLTGRRLHIETPPESVFSIEQCGVIAGLSSGERDALADHNYTNCINVFDTLIAGHEAVADCGADIDMIYAANVLAQTLDTDGDGSIDDTSVVDQIRAFNVADPKAIIVVGCDFLQEELESQAVYENFEYYMSSQGWKHDGGDYHDDVKPILVEEVFHFVHHWAWSEVYPPFALEWNSALGNCTKGAQCAWWIHPENTGCSNLDGSTCENPDGLSCNGSCSAFHEPGQCYSDGENCAEVTCDLTEFFHKVYLSYVEEPMLEFAYPFPYGSYYYGIPNVTDKLESTPACAELHLAMKSASYALPRHAYRDCYTPGDTCVVTETTVTAQATATDADAPDLVSASMEAAWPRLVSVLGFAIARILW